MSLPCRTILHASGLFPRRLARVPRRTIAAHPLFVLHRGRSAPRTIAPRHKAGFTIVELVLALGLLMVFCAVFVPVLAAITRERRAAAQEQAALQHVANVLEDLTQRGYHELASGPPDVADLPAPVRSLLTEAEQALAIDTVADNPPVLRLTVSLRWRQPGNMWTRPVTLSAWVSAPAGGQP
uniref:Type II secretion system protein n=1 Tax=Schlesneria paludicola TaxID=360056 RepID=A0A7C4QPN4_9PLAN